MNAPMNVQDMKMIIAGNAKKLAGIALKFV
jgi:hypothetical protein